MTVAAKQATTVASLREELRTLTEWRNTTITEARATIAKTNRSYDAAAVRLAKRIRTLEAKLAPPTSDHPAEKHASAGRRDEPPRSPRSGDSDWSDEDRAHYEELQRKG